MLMKSSNELVRRHNRSLVLASLRHDGPQSHTELALATGLSSATVSAITQDLEGERVLERAEQQSAGGRGRPRILFRQRRDAAHAAFIRISSDVLQYSMVDYSGTLIDRFDEPRDEAGQMAKAFTQTLRTAIAKLIARSGIRASALHAISISSKGLVADDDGTLLWSAVLGHQSVDFRAALGGGRTSSRSEHPVADWQARIRLSNESQLVAGALHARITRETGKRPTRLAALSLGHSIGLGVVEAADGAPLRAVAPNFGHMTHVHGGALCRCGTAGCIEAYSGFYAILRTAFEVPPNTLPARFIPFSEMEKIAVLARRGDRKAILAFREAGIALGNGLARLLSLYGTMPVVFTGPGIRFYELMREGMNEGLAASMTVRIEGPPEISLSLDEDRLVFEGQLHQTLDAIDRDVIAPKPKTRASA